MPNISSIIAFIDNYLEKNGKEWIDPVEANRELDRAGLLKDSATRPGLPLRKILRNGLIPHAYQPSGKGGSWHIPHSDSNASKSISQSIKSSPTRKDATMKDVAALQHAIKSARLKFKPTVVRCLLIAEAPPDSIERFFYYLDVRTADYLFLGIMEALYPDQKEKFLVSGRPSNLKEQMLRQFQTDGYYLLDVLDVPLGMYNDSLHDAVPEMIQRVSEVAKPDTPIILIKATTFEVAYSPLKAAGFTNVADIEIAFPGQGWQKVFQTKFKQALHRVEQKT